jgi:hypothetical protein
MNEEHIHGHLWHRYSITVNQVQVLNSYEICCDTFCHQIFFGEMCKPNIMILNSSIENLTKIVTFICWNIPAATAYGVYICQLIHYYIAFGSYQVLLDRGLLLTRKLLNQGFLLVKLKSSLRKFYGRHHDLVDRYGICVTNDHGYVHMS